MVKSEQIVGIVRKLEKYRKDIIGAFVVILCAMLLVYLKSDYVIKLLARPLKGMTLFFITPIEGIMVKIKISFILGIIISIPIMSYRIVALLSHRMTKKRKREMKFLLIPFATIFFTSGAFFAYYLVLPATVEFLLSCGNEFMRPNISGGEYFTFIVILLVIIGMVFELPVILVLLYKLGIVSYKKLAGKRKMAIMVIVIVVALITPTPDAFTLLVVSVPLFLLYEISIWWIYMLDRNRKEADEIVDDGVEA